MFLENFVIALSLSPVAPWALELLKDRLAAIITPLLALLNEALGGYCYRQRLNEATELAGALASLPPSVTVIPKQPGFGECHLDTAVPQEDAPGLPLAVIVFTQWWLSEERAEKAIREAGKGKKQKKSKGNERLVEPKPASAFQLSRLFSDSSARRMVAAGLIAGTLPLVHAHSFIVVMVVGAVIALLQRRWRDWFLFFLFASVLALPQMWWSTHNSAVDAKTFFEWHFGWDRGTENTLWFWLKNTGIFIPLIALAILWRGKNYLVSRRLLIYYLPFRFASSFQI